jgi:hypothetical protein
LINWNQEGRLRSRSSSSSSSSLELGNHFSVKLLSVHWLSYVSCFIPIRGSNPATTEVTSMYMDWHAVLFVSNYRLYSGFSFWLLYLFCNFSHHKKIYVMLKKSQKKNVHFLFFTLFILKISRQWIGL